MTLKYKGKIHQAGATGTAAVTAFEFAHVSGQPRAVLSEGRVQSIANGDEQYRYVSSAQAALALEDI